ncbi:hypothetical protein [Vibrio vulnificus]|uniref:hypothetical protein n=1 Tax=Vibrio vulnificus TaxID=672 RepID=UPI00313458D5
MELESLIPEIVDFVKNARNEGKSSVNLELYKGRLKIRSHPVTFKCKTSEIAAEECKEINVGLNSTGKMVTKEINILLCSDIQVAELLVNDLQQLLSVQT